MDDLERYIQRRAARSPEFRSAMRLTMALARFGEDVKGLLENRAMTVNAFAAEISVPETFVQDIITGLADPSLADMQRIADALGCELVLGLSGGVSRIHVRLLAVVCWATRLLGDPKVAAELPPAYRFLTAFEPSDLANLATEVQSEIDRGATPDELDALLHEWVESGIVGLSPEVREAFEASGEE